MAAPHTQGSEEDDLFNFDQLDPGSKYRATAPLPPAASLASTATSPRPAAGAPAAGKPAAAPKPTAAPAPSAPAPLAAAPARAEPRAQPVPPTPSAPLPVAPVSLPAHPPVSLSTLLALESKPPRRRTAYERSAATSSRGVRAAVMLTAGALALATFVNLTLAGVVWKSMTGLDRVLESGGGAALRDGSREAEADPAPAGAKVAPPAPDEGELALETAAEEIHRGEFERARARLYSLLAVIDRFDGPARARLASRAQVLAADSFREQADALEHRREEPAEQPGFLEAPAEEQR